MAQTVSRQPVAVEACEQFQANLFEICGGQSGTGTGIFLTTSVFPCQYYSTNAPF
jgi:hypothetical protein